MSPGLQQKTRTNRPSNHQKTILAKTYFLQYLPHEKNLVPRAQIAKNSTTKSMQKVTWKQAPKNTEFNPSEFKKLSKWDDSQITLKSIKILLRTPACPSCCSHGPPGCPQADKMVPGIGKWGATSLQMIAFFGHPK